jgi:purine catabolism regulator
LRFTVAELLKLPDISGIRLAAGASGVENEISRTNIMDNPDTFDWLIAGEFLLTTGYIFKDDEDMQRSIVRRLAEIHCAGMGLKVRRYFAKTPDCMVEEADRLGFPLVELPFGHSLSTVGSMINERLYIRDDERMSQALSIHRDLTKAALKSGGLSEIARVAVGFIRNPILIFDSGWHLLAWQEYPGNPLPLGSNIPLKRKEAALPKEFTDSMPPELEMFRKPIARRLPLPGGSQPLCRVMPVGGGDGSLYGYIVIWETVHTMDAADYAALEHVSISVAMERVRAREIEEIKHRISRDFFDDLLSGAIESISAARSLAEAHGLKWNAKYRCVLVRHTNSDKEDQLINHQKYADCCNLAAEICKKAAKAIKIHIVMVPHSYQTIFLAEQPEASGEAVDAIRQFAETLLEELEKAFDPREIIIAIGASSPDIMRITESYSDAQKTMRLARGWDNPERIIYADDYAAFRLLDKFVEPQQLREFTRKSIGSLIDWDKENGSDLVRTLSCYFSFSGNMSEAAKFMFIHRNTYIYRMEKIKGILKNDFANPHKLLEYQLALLAMRIAGQE